MARDEEQIGEALAQESDLSSGETGAARVSDPDDELEALLANRRRERQEKSAGFCPQCGGALQQSDRFCPKCGASLG